MSLPQSGAQRDALRRALHSSINDVLLDVDGSQARPMLNRVDLLQQRSQGAPPSVAHLRGSAMLPGQQSALAMSLGMNGGLGGYPGVSNGMLSASAVAENRILDQARAVIMQRRMIAQEKERLLERQYMMNLFQNQMANKKNVLGTDQMALGMFASQMAPKPMVEQSSTPATGNNALEVLGSNLRSRADPYIDVSSLKDPDPDDATLRRTRGGVSEPFPEKMHRMLEETEKDGLTDVVSFFSHGRAFGVHDIDRFVKEIMPKYFKQSKWNSFLRQLNLYGFVRITSGPDAGGYYHELFLKGRPNLAFHMRRVGVPQGEDRRKFKTTTNSADPDFYTMPPVAQAPVPRG